MRDTKYLLCRAGYWGVMLWVMECNSWPSGLPVIVVTVVQYTSGNSVLINVGKEEICVHCHIDFKIGIQKYVHFWSLKYQLNDAADNTGLLKITVV